MRTTVLVIWGVLGMIGCGAATVIESRRAPDLTETLNEVFVISQVGSRGELDTPGFEKALLETGRECGIRIGISSASRLELDPSVHEERMKAFGGSYVLTVDLIAESLVDDKVKGVYYDARLYRREPKKIVWRADVHLTRGNVLAGGAGEILATDLLRRLSADAVVKACEKLASPADAMETSLEW